MSQKNNDNYYPFRTVACAKCGQTFIPAPMHIYRVGTKYYCKWTCYNHRNDKSKEESAYEDNQNRPTERT